MNLAMFARMLIGSFAAWVVAIPSLAQDFSMPINNPVLDNLEFGRQIKSIVGTGQPQRSSGKVRPQRQGPSSTSLTYRVSMQRRRSNYQSFIQNMRTKGSAASAEFEDAMSKGDLIEMARPNLQKLYGLQTNNVADAYTLWLVASWGAVSDRDENVTRSELQGVRAQVAQLLSGNNGIAAAIDEIKQNMAESLLINGLIINEASLQVKNNPAARKKLAAIVLANTKREISIDLTAITLTDKGFALAGKGKL
jgi:hypothetical protein